MLKEKALGHTLWRTHCGRGHGPVVIKVVVVMRFRYILIFLFLHLFLKFTSIDSLIQLSVYITEL